MTRSYKKQAHDSIHDPIPLTFSEWKNQAHGIGNTGLAEGWKEAMEVRRVRVQQRIEENAAQRMTDPDNLDCIGDETVYCSFNLFFGESETQESLDEQYVEYCSMMDKVPSEPESYKPEHEG